MATGPNNKNENEIEICEASQEDFESIRVLINLVYPQSPWSVDYLNWQYLYNPAGKARIWVAKVGQQVVSSYAAIPHCFWFEGKTVTSWMIQDVLTHPDFRGQGLLHKLANKCSTELITEIYPLNYTFPNQFSHNSFLRNGWEVGFRIPLRQLEISESIEALNEEEQKFDFFEISPSSESLDDLWSRARQNFKYSVVRNRDYINWRYALRPDSKYFFYGVKKSDKLIAVSILKYYELSPGCRTAHICDFVVDSQSEDVLNLLLKKSIKFAQENSASKLTAWLPQNHCHEKFYDNFKFTLDEKIDRWLIISTVDSQKSADVKKSSNWNLTMGDSDVY